MVIENHVSSSHLGRRDVKKVAEQLKGIVGTFLLLLNAHCTDPIGGAAAHPLPPDCPRFLLGATVRTARRVCVPSLGSYYCQQIVRVEVYMVPSYSRI